jgi:predicted O-methyltransferase YrrM
MKLDRTIIPDEYWTGKDLLENECPWLVPEAIIKLDSIDMKDMSVLEFGAGGSTIFFARRAKSVVSCEYSSTWYNKVFAELINKEIMNVRLCSRIFEINIRRHYDLILVDNSGNHEDIIALVIKLDLTGTIVVIDNYADYPQSLKGKKIETFDDPHWNGKGTMIIYN